MQVDKLIINCSGREKRAAFIHNGKAGQIEIGREETRSLVGGIFLGIVTKVLPGMNAAFIDIGTDKNAYLHRDSLAEYVQSGLPNEERERKSISAFVRQGERLLVQVEKDPVGTKGAKVTGIIEVPGTHLVYMPAGNYLAVSKKISDSGRREELRVLGREARLEGEGLIFRTSAGGAVDEEIVSEIDRLRREAEGLLQKAAEMKKPGLVAQADVFVDKLLPIIERMESGEVAADDSGLLSELKMRFGGIKKELVFSFYSGKENILAAHGVEAELEKLLKRVVWLENGAYLLIEETETLTAIDVNTGKFSGKNSLQDTVLKTNLLAAEEIARQIRLRDLAGMILVDFIEMKTDEERSRVSAKMDAELRKDNRRTRNAGFTALGIFQLTRKRLGPSLSETLTVKCPSCGGTGRISSPETEAFKLERELWEHRGSVEEAVLVEASPSVKKVFEGEAGIHLKRLQEALGMLIIIKPVENAVNFYAVKQFGTAGELRKKADNTY